MKRFVIFLGIGPLIGYAVVFIVIRWLHPSPMRNYANVLAGIPFAYALGFLPALAAASVDWLLRRWAWRIVVTTIIGLVGSSMWAIAPYLKFHNVRDLIMFAAMGAIPAAVCSWLSSEGEHER